LPCTSDIIRHPTAALAFLLAAIGKVEPDGTDTGLCQLATGLSDWDELLGLADRHHVSPLLYQALSRAGWPAVPASARAILQARFAANLKRNFRLARHAMDALRALTDADIPVLAHKGVFMAASVYGHLSSREVHDIDLLIDPDDESGACAVLESLNFAPVGKLDQQQVFRAHDLQIEIDLHWQLAPGFFPVKYDFRALRDRSVTAQLGGMTFLTPSREDLLLMLCIQLAKDCWERRQRLVQLQKVCDIAEVVLRTPNLDWAALQGRAAEQGLSRVLDFALALATALLYVPLPPGLAARVEGDSAARSLAREVCAMPALAETTVPPEGNSLLDVRLRARQLVFYLRLRERPRDQWLYPLHVLSSLSRQLATAALRKRA
jgi:hypothetical protein